MHSDVKTPGHEACFVCQDKFCFSSVRSCEFGAGVETEMVFGSGHEGWQGIPHGGVAMTSLIDLADHCWLQVKGENLPYPLTIEWRFADVVTIGDKMHLKAVVKDDKTITVSMRRDGSEKTYLRAEMKAESESESVDFCLPDPEILLRESSLHQALAVYDNCFVCGRKRQLPGLQRRFFKTRVNPEINDDDCRNQDFSAIIVRFGGESGGDVGAQFQQAPGRLHPGVMAALLDELCGWSGVLAADELYGYTVRFHLHINYPPRIKDEFFGFSPTPRVRGRGVRQFYFPDGVLYCKKEDGSFEIIASASGQWLAREELRQQFDSSHIEEELKDIIF